MLYRAVGLEHDDAGASAGRHAIGHDVHRRRGRRRRTGCRRAPDAAPVRLRPRRAGAARDWSGAAGGSRQARGPGRCRRCAGAPAAGGWRAARWRRRSGSAGFNPAPHSAAAAPRQTGGPGVSRGPWGLGPQGLPLIKPPYGRITAYNMNTGDIVVAGRQRRDVRLDQEASGAQGHEPFRKRGAPMKAASS